jgi:hypothetical protein
VTHAANNTKRLEVPLTPTLSPGGGEGAGGRGALWKEFAGRLGALFFT